MSQVLSDIEAFLALIKQIDTDMLAVVERMERDRLALKARLDAWEAEQRGMDE